jgi:hypothetical protein
LTNKKREDNLQTVQQALRVAQFYTDGIDYQLLQLPRGAVMAAAGVVAEIGEPFCALLVDKDEVSLIISVEAYDHFAGRLKNAVPSDHPYRLLTVDVVLDSALVGFMAALTPALAQAGISVIPLGAYSRDHLLIPAHHIEIALATLKQLQSSC